jgi:hypothetical protein
MPLKPFGGAEIFYFCLVSINNTYSLASAHGSICLPADKDCSLGARTKPFKVGDILEWYLPIIWKRRKKNVMT